MRRSRPCVTYGSTFSWSTLGPFNRTKGRTTTFIGLRSRLSSVPRNSRSAKGVRHGELIIGARRWRNTRRCFLGIRQQFQPIDVDVTHRCDGVLQTTLEASGLSKHVSNDRSCRSTNRQHPDTSEMSGWKQQLRITGIYSNDFHRWAEVADEDRTEEWHEILRSGESDQSRHLSLSKSLDFHQCHQEEPG